MSTRVGISFSGDLSSSQVIKYAQLAEKEGLESVWLAENYYLRDAFSLAATVALETRQIKISTGVVNPYTRNPVLIAMTIATLDELSKKRAMLGLGACVKLQIKEQMGIRFAKPLTAMRECVEIIRKLLNGKTVVHRGHVFNIQNVRLGFKPARTVVPIYIGPQLPRMLQLTGEIGDGVLLTAGASIEHVKYAIKNVKIGARRVGRNPAELDIACYIVFSVADNPLVAMKAAKRRLVRLLSFPKIGDLWLNQCGLDTSVRPKITSDVRRGKIESAIEHVTEDMVNCFSASGTPSDCRNRLEEYRSAGVKLPIIVPVGSGLRIAIKTIGV